MKDEVPSIPPVEDEVLELDIEVSDEDDGEVMVSEEDEVIPFVIAPFLISSHFSLWKTVAC